MKIVPLFDKVVLLPKESEKESSGGIILPPPSKEKSQLASVVAVGKGGTIDGKETTMEVKVGDVVLYSKYAGTNFTMDGKDYIIVRQADILAVIE